MDDSRLWEKELNIRAAIPTSVMGTRWDVILVDAPLGYPGSGPGRYQSLYMSRILAEQNEGNTTITHVFVDDYERKIEREFAQRVFERSPIEVINRRKRIDVPANEQGHFVFGAMPSKELAYSSSSNLLHSNLVQWTYPSSVDGSIPNEILTASSTIILVEVNDGYYNFFLNWLCHYEALKINLDVVVIAEDDVVSKKLEREVRRSRPYLSIQRTNNKYMSSSLLYGSMHYKNLVSGRATHILSRLKAGKNVLYTDVDTVWRNNPMPYLSALGKQVDAILQVDTEKFDGLSPYYCTGFMAFVSNSRTIALMSAWESALQKPQLNQPIFNQLLHKKSSVVHQPLPKMEFPSGQMYFSKMNMKQRQQAVVVHNNYIQGIQNKQIRFEKYGLWKVNNNSLVSGVVSTTSLPSKRWYNIF
jgi:rhamnogalacturonan II specific xylosyltransferase